MAGPEDVEYDSVTNALLQLPDQFGYFGKFADLFYCLLEDRRTMWVPILNYLATKRWLDTADGVWLDEAGDIVGIERLAQEEIDNVFTIRGASQSNVDSKGFSGLAQPRTGGHFQGFSPLMTSTYFDDDVYRNWVQAKAGATFTDATHDDIYDFVKTLLGVHTIVRTTGTREDTIQLTSPLSQGTRARLRLLAPTAAGIRLIVKNP
jgi:hypothetical protein